MVSLNSQLHMDFSPAAERNREPIWTLLKIWLDRIQKEQNLQVIDCLEIASGTGQHAAFFASQCQNLVMWPSDQTLNRSTSVSAWSQEAQVSERVRALHLLDVTQVNHWPNRLFPLIYCANMVHISPWACTESLFKGAGLHLLPKGILVMYGPYRLEGQGLAPSNITFDESLKQRDSRWGIRDLNALDQLAQQSHLTRVGLYECPANNHLVIFQKNG